MQKNIIISVIISVAIVIGSLFFLKTDSPKDLTNSSDIPKVVMAKNIEIKDGVQYIIVHAGGGYSPKVSTAKVGILTKLIIKTNNTYDCSASLVIHQIGFKKILKPTGEEVIDLGILKSGESIQGLCSMGMYSFQIKVTES